jgi:hypothetical protein
MVGGLAILHDFEAVSEWGAMSESALRHPCRNSKIKRSPDVDLRQGGSSTV